MTNVRRRFAGELKKNWGSIILSAFFTAVLPVCAIVFDQASAKLAVGVSIYSLSLLIARAGR